MKNLYLIYIILGEVYDPNYLGRQDILIGGTKIISMYPSSSQTISSPLVKVIEMHGALALPGLVDPHVHLSGGGTIGLFNFIQFQVKSN